MLRVVHGAGGGTDPLTLIGLLVTLPSTVKAPATSSSSAGNFGGTVQDVVPRHCSVAAHERGDRAAREQEAAVVAEDDERPRVDVDRGTLSVGLDEVAAHAERRPVERERDRVPRPGVQVDQRLLRAEQPPGGDVLVGHGILERVADQDPDPVGDRGRVQGVPAAARVVEHVRVGEPVQHGDTRRKAQ